MTSPDMRKNWGSPCSFFSETELENFSFLEAFVCVSIASPRVHKTKPLRQKNCTKIFFQKPPEPSWYISLGTEKEKNGGHRARFCSANKIVSYRHWHSCQTSQKRRSHTIGFSARPLHPMDWPWRSLLNSELWTRSIAIRFRSSRGSLSIDVTTGSSYQKKILSRPIRTTLLFFFIFLSFYVLSIVFPLGLILNK